MGRPTLEDLRQQKRDRESREMEEKMALRWAKDQLLYWAAGRLLEYDARLPEDATEFARAYTTLLKVALREFWDSYDLPPDYSYPRPFSGFEPPEDFDFGAVMEREHERMDERFRQEYGDLPEPGVDDRHEGGEEDG